MSQTTDPTCSVCGNDILEDVDALQDDGSLICETCRDALEEDEDGEEEVEGTTD